MAERVQRWLIDSEDFCNTEVKRSLKQYYVDKMPSFDINRANKFLNLTFLAESVAGRSLYFLISGMVFRSIELFYQSTNSFLYASAISKQTKGTMYLLCGATVIGFNLYLGYTQGDVLIRFILPFILDKILSFGWSNYFKQIQALSGTKNFELKDFCFRNFQAFLLQLAPSLLHFIFAYTLGVKAHSGSITVCEISLGKFIMPRFIHPHSNNAYLFSIIMEAIALSLGKIVFDLAYIFTLVLLAKTLSRDVDLRDPMGWMFSKFGSQVSSSIENQEEQEEQEEVRYQKPRNRRIHRNETTSVQNETPSSETSPASPGESSGGVKWISGKEGKGDVKRGPKNKDPIDDVQGDKKKEPKDVVKKTNNSPSRKPVSRVSVKVGNTVLKFQQLFYPSHNKGVWGVIITDSVEKQTLVRYWNGLANGYIGGGTISPLTKFGGKLFEIRPGTDSRLIGKLHDGDHYFSLQSYMPMEDALQFSRELERYGIDEKVSLIVFSKEAKKHNDINRVAKSL